MLQISRDDVRSDILQDFPQDKKFIKLPIDKYLQLLNIEPISSQIALINAINNPKYRFVCAALSRRQGKTFISNVIGQLVCLVPNCNVLIMSPNYSLSQISFDLQRQLIRHFDLEVEKDNAKDKIIELSNHSTIRMGSVNQADSVVGRSYDLIIFDEAALTTDGEEAFNINLRPTLDKANSKAIFISTPRGKNNWFALFYYRGFTDKYTDWVSIKADYVENPRVDKRDIEEAKMAMSAAEFAQEYEADFTVFTGQIYSFDTEKCVQDLSMMDRSKLEMFAGIDFGFRDPTAMVIIGYSFEDEKYYVFKEYIESERTSDEHALAIKKILDEYNVEVTFVDHSAAQTRYDWAQLHNISTNAANKSVLDGIAFCQTIVENDRLIVDVACTNLIAALDQYKWDDRSTLITEKPDHYFSDLPDALRYGLYSYQVGSFSV